MTDTANEELELSRRRMERFFKLMYEEPKRKNFYQYYAQYNWLRASDWQTRIWLEKVNELVEQFNSETVDTSNMKIQLSAIKNQLVSLLSGVQKTEKLASKYKWRVKRYGTMKKWIRAIYERAARIRKVIKHLENPSK